MIIIIITRQDLNEVWKKAHHFLNDNAFLNFWLGTNSQKDLLKRYNPSEAIEGFKNVKSLQEILKPVSQEVRILKNQHESRVAALRETTTAKRGRAKG